MKRLLVLLAFAATPLFAQQSRIASDFEIAEMKQQIARSHDFISQLSGHLNLGDLYISRNERTSARAEYTKAVEIADGERVSARRSSDMTRYATACSYAALAQAKLGRDDAMFALLEEATRFSSDSAKSWNLYASAMTVVHKPQKAVAAARNAVTLAERELAKDETLPNRLDLAVYQYALASALVESGDRDEAERLLRTVTSSLRSKSFAPLRRQVASNESFEIYSSARGDEAAYLSLVNRAGLRLAALLEQRGDTAGARAEYQRVLELRTDDATALAGLARLAPRDADRDRYFAAAFDANPFSMALVREYQKYLTNGKPEPVDDSTTGGKVRLALAQMARGETRAARVTLDALIAQFPSNETLRILRSETDTATQTPPFLTPTPGPTPVRPTAAELRQLLALSSADRLTPEQRTTLDNLTFSSTTVFAPSATAASAGQTIFESGTVEGVAFRFSEPTAFKGTFAADSPLRMTYRVLGATESGGSDALLLEPLGLEAQR